MRKYSLDSMKKGWFVGNFNRAVHKTEAFEVAVKVEKAGEHVDRHLHNIAAEITVVVKGRICVNGKEFRGGDIIVISPKEDADYKVLEDAITVIVKIPSVRNDKIYVKGKL